MAPRYSDITAGLLISPLLTAALIATSSHAADHREAPAAQAIPAADIGDYYAWHGEDQINLVLTFNPFTGAGEGANYNSDILYGFHFDTSDDQVSDVDLYARFAQDVQGNWGIQFTDVDGTTLEGAVETVLESGDTSVWAGLADDPFFFDQTGFVETITTGELSFDPDRDDVAGLNVTAIVIQLPVASITASGDALQTWSTTSTL